MKLIELNIAKIQELCKRYKVKTLYVFGSILTNRFNDESDVDFAVDFDSEAINRDNLDWADIFFGFMHALEDLLKRKVDLVFNDRIQNPYFKEELDSTKKLIYG